MFQRKPWDLNPQRLFTAPAFESGSSSSRMTSVSAGAAVAGIEPASRRLTAAFPYQHGTHRIVHAAL